MGPPSTVTCGSSDETIMDYQVCDFKRGMLSVIRLVTVSKKNFPNSYLLDCLNGWDESNCGACTFEDGQCGFIDFSVGSYKWLRDRGGVSGTNSGPSTDHTLGNSEG